MPMTRRQAYKEIIKMAAYMSFPFCVYVFGNRDYMFEGLIEKKLKTVNRESIKEQFAISFRNPTMDYVFDITRKIDELFTFKKKKD